MMPDLSGRSFVKVVDFEPAELSYLIERAAVLKAEKAAGLEEPALVGKNIALIFEKTSTRTRAAFEVAAYDQGAHVTYLDPSGSQMGHKESTADTARVLGRMYDAIEYRGSAQENVEILADYAGVPVYNGLTNEWHPTQMLADFLTMDEHTDKPLRETTFAFLGDGRYNMGRSLLVMGALMGCDVRMVGPAAYAPPGDVVAMAEGIATQTGARILITEDAEAGVTGADFIHADVWVSMGEPKDVWHSRVAELTPYQVNAGLLAATGNGSTRFMHCLPAFHDANTIVGAEIMGETEMSDGLEVTHDVFESDASIVFDQAENRMHTIKAVLVETLG
jgi:ornithine carbamoyltransferase